MSCPYIGLHRPLLSRGPASSVVSDPMRATGITPPSWLRHAHR